MMNDKYMINLEQSPPLIIKSILIFIYTCIANGIVPSIIKICKNDFSPYLFNLIRMFSGLFFSIIILIFQYNFNYEFRILFKENFFCSFKIFFHIFLNGILYLGIPQLLMAISQKNIESSIILLFKPLAPLIGSIISHFLLFDEPFTFRKFISLIFGIIGVFFTVYPTFLNNSIFNINLIKSYLILIFSIIILSISFIHMKLKVLNINIHISTFFQLLGCFLFNLLLILLFNRKELLNINIKINLFYPILIGLFSSTFVFYSIIFLINEFGAVITSYNTFGQIFIGVFIGIFLLKEWKNYNLNLIIISIIGILFLLITILIGIFEKKFNYKKLEISNLNSNLI